MLFNICLGIIVYIVDFDNHIIIISICCNNYHDIILDFSVVRTIYHSIATGFIFKIHRVYSSYYTYIIWLPHDKLNNVANNFGKNFIDQINVAIDSIKS